MTNSSPPHRHPIDGDFLDLWCDKGSSVMLCYYRGFIGRDLPYAEDEEFRIILDHVNKQIISYYLTGWFELAQSRNGSEDYSYFIIRRVARDTMPRLWLKDRAEDLRSATILRKRTGIRS